MMNWKEYLKFEDCKKISFSGACSLDMALMVEIPIECINGISFYHLHENQEILFEENPVDVKEITRCDGLMVRLNQKLKDYIYENKELMAPHEYHSQLIQDLVEQLHEKYKEEFEEEKNVNVDEWLTENTDIQVLNLIYEDGTKSPDIYLPFEGWEPKSNCVEYIKCNPDSKDYSWLHIVDRECENSCDFQP